MEIIFKNKNWKPCLVLFFYVKIKKKLNFIHWLSIKYYIKFFILTYNKSKKI